MQRDLVLILLDLLGLLLMAAGAGALAGVVLGWGGLAVSGGVVLAGRWWASRLARPEAGTA